MNTLVCSSAYIGYEPLTVPVTLPLFVSVVSCTGLYTVVAIYIYWEGLFFFNCVLHTFCIFFVSFAIVFV